MSDWVLHATQLLTKSLHPIPVELNELDWKSDLSDKTDRLAQHISAFANNPGGGFLTFGISDDGKATTLDKQQMDSIVQRLGNIARNNLTPVVSFDHAIIDFEGHPVLLICIPESKDKPVYLRGKTILDSYKRSAGQTVKQSQLEVKHLVAISSGYTFEEHLALAKVSDDDVLRLLDYDSYFTLQEKRLPDTKQGILGSLASEELYINQMENGISLISELFFLRGS